MIQSQNIRGSAYCKLWLCCGVFVLCLHTSSWASENLISNFKWGGFVYSVVSNEGWDVRDRLNRPVRSAKKTQQLRKVFQDVVINGVLVSDLPYLVQVRKKIKKLLRPLSEVLTSAAERVSTIFAFQFFENNKRAGPNIFVLRIGWELFHNIFSSSYQSCSSLFLSFNIPLRC